MKQQGKAYTIEQKREIIERIADRMMDGMSLRKICESDDMPPKTTVLRWLNADDNQELVTTIATARGLQSEAKFDQIDDILADVRSGELPPQAARVMIWAIQWQLAKLQPKRYGDRITQEVSGPSGAPISTISSTMSEEEAARIYRDMVGR